MLTEARSAFNVGINYSYAISFFCIKQFKREYLISKNKCSNCFTFISDVNECANSSICEKGSCHNNIGSYYCLYDDNSDKYGDNSSHPRKGMAHRILRTGLNSILLYLNSITVLANLDNVIFFYMHMKIQIHEFCSKVADFFST